MECIESFTTSLEKENVPIDEAPAEQLEPVVTIAVESPHEAGQGRLSSAISTPLTVRDRVKEYNTRAGQSDDGSLSDAKSLSSSQCSLQESSQKSLFYEEKPRLTFDKDDKEWILAASACDMKAMQRLLAANKRLVNYKFPFNGFAALHFAAKANRTDCCKFLVDNGATADAKTYAGQTPLHLACQQECREVMEFLMKLPSKASHTPDYSGKLPHELIRSRDAFGEILYRASSAGLEKRGSFLGEYPGSLLKSDSISVSSASSSGSSWLSGVRASFRGKASQQAKSKPTNSLHVPGSQGSRVPLLLQQSPASVASVLAAARTKRSHSSANNDGFAVPAAVIGTGSILDSLAAGGGHGHGQYRQQNQLTGDKKMKHRCSKKTL